MDPAPLGKAPLVGRDPEMARLRRACDAVLHRRAVRVLTLVGPSGMGKKRLLDQITAEISEGHPELRLYHAEREATSTTYGALARLLRSRLGVTEATDPAEAHATVHREVSGVLGDRRVGDVCYFLGELMGIEFAESPITRAVSADPAQARSVRRAVVKSFIQADAEQGLLVLRLDALEQADEDSIELLGDLFSSLEGGVLVLSGARPEFLGRHPEWRHRFGDRHELIELGPLSDEDSIALLQSLLQSCLAEEPPPRLIEAGVSMAGGTPGLLEHILQVFQDAGVLVARGDGAGLEVDLKRLTNARLPLTVEDAVATRVAGLSPDERRALEQAACMGQVFWFGALLSLRRIDREAPELWTADDDTEELRRLLQHLAERDFVLELPDSTFPDEVEYVFKHALERESIGSLTSPAIIRRYHRTIADYLERKAGVRNQEEHAAMLARHLELSGASYRAALLYLELGNRARAHFAAKRASEYYEKGLKLLGNEDAGRRVDALHDFGDVLLLLGRTEDALSAFRSMLSIAYRLRLKSKGGAAQNRIGRLFRETGSLSLAEQHLTTALDLFKAAGDERGVASCHDDIGKLLWMRGEYEAALTEMRRSLGMRERLGDGRSIALSLNNIGLVWRDHGRVKKAEEALKSALQIRRELNDPLGIVESLNNLAQLALDQGEHQEALKLLEEGQKLAYDIGEPGRNAVVLTNLGEACLRLGDADKANEAFSRAIALCEELGDKVHLGEAKRGLARALLARGELRQARDAIKQSVDLLGQVRSKPHLAVALRTLGEVTGAGAWGDGHEGKAVDYFMRSIAICKEIDNELELAKSYRAFSDYVETSPHYQHNADIVREAKKVREMADEIFGRHRLRAQDPQASVKP